MNNATTPAPEGRRDTIRPAEAAHFGALATDWWDPKGSSAMLHRLNPVRLAYLRDATDTHFGGDGRAIRPLAGRNALDVGCGAGLLCEPLARLGAQVVGIDAAPANIAAAKAHAQAMGLAIEYQAGDIAEISPNGFDLVCAMEVIEHVADKAAFMAALASALAPGGLLVISTPNRTARSRMLLVEAAERLGQVPRGTHHWSDFVTPPELGDLLAAAGLTVGALRGIGWSPIAGLHLTDDLALNYIVTAVRA